MPASFVQLPSEILIDPEISALDLRIYAICMDFGRKSRGFSQIGNRHLGRLVGKHPKTIAKSIKRLTELGYIKVERIGLNRNDRLRCKKTVKREKSDVTPTIHQEGTPTLPSSISTIEYKKRYKDRSNILLSNTSKETPPITTPDAVRPTTDTVRPTTTTQAIEEHQGLTRDLRNHLKGSICPATYSRWFQDLIVLDNKSDELTISAQKSVFSTDFIKTNYSEVLNKIAKKKVNIVAWGYGQFHNAE
jgi:DNA-binding Lrp family transcriptional regulator